MLVMHGDHTTYRESLPSLDPAVWGEIAAWCRRADFEPLRPTLSPPPGQRGRPGRDPVALFRTLARQAPVGKPSITAWVRRVRQTPDLARLCGWTATTVPAASTLYAFLSRQYPDPDRRRGAVRAPSGRRGPVLARGEKLPPRRPGAIDRVAARVTRERARPLRPRVADAWDALLAQVVAESVRRGALPAPGDLAADGTGLVSGAHSLGRKICACPGRRRRCRRSVSDPTVSASPTLPNSATDISAKSAGDISPDQQSHFPRSAPGESWWDRGESVTRLRGNRSGGSRSEPAGRNAPKGGNRACAPLGGVNPWRFETVSNTG